MGVSGICFLPVEGASFFTQYHLSIRQPNSLLGLLCLLRQNSIPFFQIFTFPNVTALAEHRHLSIEWQEVEECNTSCKPSETAGWRVLKIKSFQALLRAISDKLNSNPFSKHD